MKVIDNFIFLSDGFSCSLKNKRNLQNFFPTAHFNVGRSLNYINYCSVGIFCCNIYDYSATHFGDVEASSDKCLKKVFVVFFLCL